MSLLANFELDRPLYEEFRLRMEDLLRNLLREEGIPFHSLTSRVKTVESLARKLQKQREKPYERLGEVTDLVGLRVTTYFSSDVDQAVRIIEREFQVDAGNSGDRRRDLAPTEFGYLSVHHIVSMLPARTNLREYARFNGLRAEIQSRSVLQHAWAEIEHDLGYKSKEAIPAEFRRRFSRIAGLLEIADEEFVALRTHLTQYSEALTARLRDADDAVEVNRDSLREYYELSAVPKKADEAIAEAGNCELLEYDADERDLIRLKAVGLQSIGDVDSALIAHTRELPSFARSWLGRPARSPDVTVSFSRGVCFFYLCYVLAAKSQDLTTVEQYLRNVGISATAENARELATKLIGTWRDIASG